MKDLVAMLTPNLTDALSLAEELVSAPGNDSMVVWLQPVPGGVTLRQEFLAAPKLVDCCDASIGGGIGN